MKKGRIFRVLLTVVLMLGVINNGHGIGVSALDSDAIGEDSEPLGEPVCGLEESEGHTHTEDCYCQGGELICETEESEGHTHNDECYTDGVLTCLVEESEGHSHDEDCYCNGGELICGQEESEGHVHTEECYEKALDESDEADDSNMIVYSEDAGSGSLQVAKASFQWIGGASKTEITENGTVLKYTPVSNNYYTSYVTGQVDFSVGGESIIEPYQVEIKIPYALFMNRRGNWDQERVEVPIPQYPSTNGKDGFNYRLDKENNQIIISNYEEINGAFFFTATIRWQITPQYIVDGSTNDAVKVEFDVKAQSGESVHKESETHTISIDTDFKEAKAGKTPISSGKFETWIDSWGPKPADADDYFYVAWSVSSMYYYEKTQPVTVVGEDIPVDGEIVGILQMTSGSTRASALNATLKTDENGMIITDTQMEIYRESISGRSNDGWKTANRTILVRYPKTEAIEGNTFSNTWRTTTTGFDGESRTTEATATYTYKPVDYTLPAGWTDASKKYRIDRREASLNVIRSGIPLMSTATISVSGSSDSLGTNEDRTYATSTKEYTYVLDEDKMYMLTEDLAMGDFYFTEFRPAYDENNPSGVENYDYWWSEDNEKWESYLSGDFDRYQNVTILVKTEGSDEFVQWGLLKRTSETTYRWTEEGKDPVEVNYGDYISLPENCVDIQFSYPSSAARVHMEFNLHVQLNPTEHMLAMLEKEENKKYNDYYKDGYYPVTNQMSGSKYEGDTLIYSKTAEENDWIYGIQASSGMTKNALTARTGHTPINNSVQKYYRNEYSIKEYESVYYSGWTAEEMLELIEQTNIIHNHHDGVFYDLLPLGCSIEVDSVKIYPFAGTDDKSDIKSSPAWQPFPTTVELIENYRGSGRTMVIARAEVPDDYQNFYITLGYIYSGFEMRYRMINTWENIQDNGKVIVNSAGYYSNDGELTNGYKDDGGKLSMDKEIMTDLDDNGNAGDEMANVLYAEARDSINPVMALSLGFRKHVKATEDARFSQQTAVPAGGNYTYQLRFANNKDTLTKNVVLFDVLETAYNDNPFWQGTLKSIDVSHPLGKGIDVKIYYSTSTEFKNLSVHGEYTNLEKEDLWSLTPPDDLDDVTAIAIDLRYDTEGDEYVFMSEESTYVNIYMQAPKKYQPYVDDTETEEDETVYAYNSAYIQSTTKPEGGVEKEGVEECPRTTVSIEKPETEIHKTSNPESGTEDDPTDVTIESSIVYDIPVKNTSEKNVLTNIEVVDRIPEGLEIQLDEIRCYFGTSSVDAAAIDEEPRVSMKTDEQTITFTVDRLDAQEEIHFLIPTEVEQTEKNADGAVFANTAEITKFNDMSWEISSETTYHETSKISIEETLSVEKKVLGEPREKEETFTFELQGKSDAPMPEESLQTVSITGEGNASFGKIKFWKAGTYEYTVVEKDDSVIGYTYDASVYTVVVNVEEDEGKLHADISYLKNREAADSILFENTYEIPKGTLVIKKTVSGTDVNEDDTFTFTLTLYDEKGNALSGSFGGVEFDANGQYQFVLKAGEEITISGIPAGSVYHLNENDHGGYKVTVNGTDAEQASGSIKADDSTSVTFNNHKDKETDPTPDPTSTPEPSPTPTASPTPVPTTPTPTPVPSPKPRPSSTHEPDTAKPVVPNTGVHD